MDWVRAAVPDRLKKVGPKTAVSLRKDEDIKLKVSAQAWKPRRAATESADEVLFRKFRSILNKLTPEKFEALLTQVKALEIKSQKQLSHITCLVLDKALDETHFACTYAQLCNTLLREFSVASEGDPKKRVNFRQLLLQKCQAEFEKDTAASKEQENELQRGRKAQLAACKPKRERKELQELSDEADQKTKRRSLGLMTFIGQLYNLGVLSYAIMHECFLKLLRTPDDEASVVCACKLFTTVGKKVSSEGKEGGREAAKTEKKFSMLLHRLRNLISLNKRARKSHAKHLPQRIIFMMEDVCELEKNCWVPRIRIQAPKTLGEIKEEADREKHVTRLQPDLDSEKRSCNPKAIGEPRPGQRPTATKKNRVTYSLIKDEFHSITLPRSAFPSAPQTTPRKWTSGVRG
ncbi:eukaryotic translation initiation factor 4 gamma 3-like [Galendromus occidentalis]|uniref:Eukaryotic translation initiation factor 4 gamma 3-like n=1 Tax=Galendromus occidentalis TaxID=34638 RepID=A0AAJ6QX38_9ACAR|nr:eukaryotic translation initiation factor 4 gamma 3-like [Galendromus occidentalis]